ncbi:MAG TPA: HEAT repeat domain-containing protein [Allosphingosinicella sp.]|nr:HEAT repeat domain-containing protein [Allosphingosinicella sp.]
MIIGQALADWFADEERQSATLARLEEVRRRLRSLPPFAALERLADSADRRDPEPLLAAARTFLQDEDAIGDCLDLMVGAALEDPYFRPPMRNALSEIQAGLLLVDRPSLSVYLSIASVTAIAEKRLGRTGSASIAFTGRRSVYRFLRGGEAVLSLWEAPDIAPGFSAETSGSCRLVERRAVLDGDLLELDGRRHGFVIEHARSDIVYLQASTPTGSAPLAVEYDSHTMRFAGASSSDELSSRIQLMLSLLRTLDRQDAAPLFREMANGAHFFDRWHAMREFLALDAEQALPCLRDMAERDPHPEVRSAARSTLALFFAEAEPDREAAPCHA